jgi:hypothetical protein
MLESSGNSKSDSSVKQPARRRYPKPIDPMRSYARRKASAAFSPAQKTDVQHDEARESNVTTTVPFFRPESATR